MFSHILCATDLSPRSSEALRVAVHMAAKYNARLTLLNVHEEFMDKDEMVMLRVSAEQMQQHFREIAMEQKPFQLSVKAVVLDSPDRCLAIRRSRESKNNPGAWDLPGGKNRRWISECVFAHHTRTTLGIGPVLGQGNSW